MANAGDIKVTLSLDAKKFANGMKQSEQAAKKLGTTAKRAEKETQSLGKAMGTVAKKALLFVAAFRVAKNVVVGLASSVSSMQKLSKETQIWSETLGIGTTKLQEFTIASQEVGFEAEKVNDVLKDVSEKIGEFVSSGGGEAKDIFKRLNIGLEQFRDLDAIDILQKMQAAIERLDGTTAELTKGERIAVFEALANDASKFNVLLADGGRELKKFSKIAQESGAIISPEEHKRMEKLTLATRRLGLEWTGLKQQIVLSLVDPIILAIKKMRRLIRLAKDYAGLPAFIQMKVLDETGVNNYDPNTNIDKSWEELKRIMLNERKGKKELLEGGEMNKLVDIGRSQLAALLSLLEGGGPNAFAGNAFSELGLSVGREVVDSLKGVFGGSLIGSKNGPTLDGDMLTWLKPVGDEFGSSTELFKDAVTEWKAGLKKMGDIFKSQNNSLLEDIVNKDTEVGRNDKIERLLNILSKDTKAARKASPTGSLTAAQAAGFATRADAIEIMIGNLPEFKHIAATFKQKFNEEGLKRGMTQVTSARTITLNNEALMTSLDAIRNFGKQAPQKPQEVLVKLTVAPSEMFNVTINNKVRTVTFEELNKITSAAAADSGQ